MGKKKLLNDDFPFKFFFSMTNKKKLNRKKSMKKKKKKITGQKNDRICFFFTFPFFN